MALGYVRLVWQQTPGPKLTVVAMSLVAGIANGTVLAVINSAIAARVEGAFGWRHVALFTGALVLYLVGSYFAMFRATELAGRLMHSLRGRMVDELARSSVQAVERYGRGEIIAHFSEDIATIGDTALKLVGVVNSIVLTVFCLGYLAVLSPLTLAVTVLFVVVGIGVYFWQEGLAKRLLASARQDEAEYYGSVGDVLGGFKELRLSRAVARDLTRHMERISDRFRRGFARAEFIFFSGAMTSKVLLFAVLGAVALVPEALLQTTGVSAFQILAVLLFTFAPLESLVDFVGPYLRAQVACDKLAAFSAAMAEGRERAAEDGAPLRLEGPIALDGVTMHYMDPELGETFRLGPIELAIEPGEIVFLAGGNGSGKSTLLKVIAGLYPLHGGRLMLNGAPIDEARLNAYRALISAVFQDFHIFPQLYGLDPMPRARIESDLARIGLAEKVELLADCFSTTRLSGGERKRLALVVALAGQRPLLLLDEFGAEQDPEFRAFFYREFLPGLRAQGLTIVAVTHDDAFFDCCDRIVRMDHGRIRAVERVGPVDRRASVSRAGG